MRDHAALATLRSLSALVDQNLIRVDDVNGRPHFRLSDLVREFAFDLLVRSAEVDSVMTRLAEYSLAQAHDAALTATRRRERLERLESTSPTYDVVFEWARTTARVDLGLRLAKALWMFWWSSGAAAIGMSWLRPLVDMVERGVAHVEEAVLADAYRQMAGLSEALGLFAEAMVFAERSLTIARRLGDPEVISSLLNGLGVDASMTGDDAGAKAFFEESLAMRREIGNTYIIATTLCDLGQHAANSGDFGAAFRYVGESIGLFRDCDSSIGISIALGVSSLISVRSGDYDGAESFARKCIHMNEEQIAFAASQALANLCLGRVALARDDRDAAADRLDEALELYEKVNDASGIADSLDAIAALDHRIGHHRDAARMLGAAAALRERQNEKIVPAERVAHAALVNGVKRALGRAPFDAEWLIARALPFDHVRSRREPGRQVEAGSGTLP